MSAIAIDFGTSNTIVSILEPDTKNPKTLRFPKISRLFKARKKGGEAWEIAVVPTLAFIKEPNQLVLGNQVRSQRLGFSQPHRLFKAFKRDLAADFQPPPRQLDGNSYTPEFVSELFIQAIWEQIQQQSIQPTEAIFTLPVGAFERYLDWFRDLGSRLGVSEVKLVDESTAAALGYAIEHPGSIVLVIDFGGGTLDLSLVRIDTDPQSSSIQGSKLRAFRAEVLAKSDAYIGGEDIDLWIVEDRLQQLGMSREKVGEIAWQNLLEIAEQLKIRLSREEEAKESWFDDTSFTFYDVQLNRRRLEEILEQRQLLEQLRGSLDEVLSIALTKGIGKSEIDRVLLVGGSCLIPAVQNAIVSYFGRQKIKLDKPFEAVCHGALALTKIEKIDDYLRHSYAIRLWQPDTKSYSYFTLFDKGVKYPTQREEPLTLQVATEGQKEIRLDIGELAEISQPEVIYEASGRMKSSKLKKQTEYRSLEIDRGQVCVAHLNPPGQVGIDRISVQFEVNDKRVLLATVRDLLTGKLLVKKRAIANLK